MADTAPVLLHRHSVKFYADDRSLFETVSSFLAEGLASGQPAIVIATEAHRAGIVDHLCDRMIDCARAANEGALVVLDAEETLARFMVRGEPNADLFREHVGGVVRAALDRRTSPIVRAYGEMVDLLWKQGRRDAAISLEILWNELAATHNFALLCGYAMGNFYKEAQHFERVSAQHDHVMRDEPKVVPFPSS